MQASIILAMTYRQQMKRYRERRLRAAKLRAQGKSWAEIGTALGVSRQRAHQLASGAPK